MYGVERLVNPPKYLRQQSLRQLLRLLNRRLHHHARAAFLTDIYHH